MSCVCGCICCLTGQELQVDVWFFHNILQPSFLYLWHAIDMKSGDRRLDAYKDLDVILYLDTTSSFIHLDSFFRVVGRSPQEEQTIQSQTLLKVQRRIHRFDDSSRSFFFCLVRPA